MGKQIDLRLHQKVLLVVGLCLGYADLVTDILATKLMYDNEAYVLCGLSIAFLSIATLLCSFVLAIPNADSSFQPLRFVLGLFHLSLPLMVRDSLVAGKKMEALTYNTLFTVVLENCPQLIIQTIALINSDKTPFIGVLSLSFSLGGAAFALVSLEKEAVVLDRIDDEMKDGCKHTKSIAWISTYFISLFTLRIVEVVSRVALFSLFVVSFQWYYTVLLVLVDLLFIAAARYRTLQVGGDELEREWQPWSFVLIWIFVYFDFCLVRKHHVVLAPFPYYAGKFWLEGGVLIALLHSRSINFTRGQSTNNTANAATNNTANAAVLLSRPLAKEEDEAWRLHETFGVLGLVCWSLLIPFVYVAIMSAREHFDDHVKLVHTGKQPGNENTDMNNTETRQGRIASTDDEATKRTSRNL